MKCRPPFLLYNNIHNSHRAKPNISEKYGNKLNLIFSRIPEDITKKNPEIEKIVNPQPKIIYDVINDNKKPQIIEITNNMREPQEKVITNLNEFKEMLYDFNQEGEELLGNFSDIQEENDKFSKVYKKIQKDKSKFNTGTYLDHEYLIGIASKYATRGIKVPKINSDKSVFSGNPLILGGSELEDFIVYNLSETENKRYEFNISKSEFNEMNKLFKIYDNNKQIFELLVKLFDNNKYKIKFNNLNEKMNLELYFVIVNNNVDISVELNMNLNGDFRDDYNYILKNEIFELKKNFNKDINDLKKENKSIKQELNEIKGIINNLYKNHKSVNNNINNSIIIKESKNIYDNINDNTKNLIEMAFKKKDKNLDLSGKKIDFNYLRSLMNYPYLEKLNLSNCNIYDISALDKCSFKHLQLLNLSNNQIKDIFSLKQIQFQKLTELYLDQNKISNIEPLSKIDLTHLERLNLSHNNISEISVFDRVNAPHLKYLNLSYNYIDDITVFGSDEFKEMKALYLDNNRINVENNSYIIEHLFKKITEFSCKDNS